MAGQRRVSAIKVTAPNFERNLKKAFAELELESFGELQAVAIETQNRARQLCPVDTGRLRSSIQHKAGRDERGRYIDVGTNVHYAAYVEYGTRHMRAQPFLRPAVAETVALFGRGQRKAAS